LSCTINKRNIPVGFLLQLVIQGHQGSFIFFQSPISTRGAEGSEDCGSQVFTAEKVDEAGREVVRIYHNGRCSDALGGLLEDCQTSDYVPQ
jgi:hypothetical protein